MSGRRRTTLSPTLFPFLAVLVCTLGTLILLLALVAQNATQAAEQQAQDREEALAASAAAAKQPTRPTAEEVERRFREQEFRVTELVAHREKQTAAIEEKRTRLTHLEDHVRRIREELRRLNEEVDAATSDDAIETPDANEIVLLEKQLDAERAALEQAQSELDDPEPRIVIVPHQGPNGTDRRPVYLECTSDGITIWPEGSKISLGQLDALNARANPVDSALRAIRHYSMQNYGDQIPPYPLLVVRPGGIETYAAARRAMNDWDDQFGYELVAEDAKLAFPNPDKELKRRIDEAIRLAVIQQHAQQAVAARAAVRRRSGTLPPLSAAKLERMARSSGYGSRKPDAQPLAQDRQSRRYGAAADYLSRAGTGMDRSTPSTTRNPYAQPQSGPYGSGFARAGDGGAGVAQQLEQHLRDAANELNSSSTPAGPKADAAQSATGDSSSTPDEEPTLFQAGTDDTTNADDAEMSGSKGEADGENSSGPAEASPTGVASAEASGTRWADVGHASDDAAMSANGFSASGSQSLPASPQAAAAAGGMPMSGAGGQETSQEQQPERASPPQAMPASTSDQLVQREGRDWALPRKLANRSGTQIVRTIRVRCYPDRFVLMPGSRSEATEIFGLSNGDVNRASLELATAIRDRVARWGAPLPGGRWQPRLDVQVVPQAEHRFHQLRTLLQGSGVEVQQVPLDQENRR